MKTYLMNDLVVMAAMISASNAEAEGWLKIKAIHSNKCLDLANNDKECCA